MHETTSSVIVADDDVIMRGILRSIMTGMDEAVFLAASGDEVLELAKTIRCKLFLLDLHMPKMNGLVTCERLRELPDHANTPIVILTALNGEPARQAAALAGSTLFLTKPFRPATLMQAVSPYLILGRRG